MIQSLITKIDNVSERYLSRNPFTNVYGLARTLLALGTLSTFLFNDIHSIFIESYVDADFGTTFNFVNLFKMLGYDNILISKAIVIIVLLWVVSGYLPQVSSILHWWVSFSFFQICPVVDGGDQITCIITLFLIPIALIDPRLNHWYRTTDALRRNGYVNIVLNVILFLIKLQFLFLYFQAGADKLKVTEWVDGTSVYYWFNHSIFGSPSWLRPLINPMLVDATVVSGLTWGSIILEFVLAAGFFMTPSRKLILFWIGILFHFSIVLVLGLVSFFFAMAGGLVLYLLPIEKEIQIPKINLKNPFIKKDNEYSAI